MASQRYTRENPLSIRASSIGDYLDCPYAWFQRHILRVEEPMSLPLALGTAFHAGVESLLQGDSLDLAMHIVCEVAADEMSDDDISVSDVEPIMGLLTEFEVSWLGKIKAKYTEKEAELDLFPKLQVPVLLTGHLDTLTQSRHLVDYKTTTRRWKIENKVGYQLQMTAYYVLAEHAGWAPERETTFLVAVKPKCEIYPEVFTVSDQSIEYLYNVIRTIYFKAEHGAMAFDARRTFQYCAHGWCHHARQCEANWGGHVKMRTRK